MEAVQDGQATITGSMCRRVPLFPTHSLALDLSHIVLTTSLLSSAIPDPSDNAQQDVSAD